MTLDCQHGASNRETSDSVAPQGCRSRVPWLLLLAGLCCLAALVWPGDIPWINDEPGLVLTARYWNRQHCLAPVGLIGSRGMPYGPLPIWWYQAALAMTRDLVLIAWVKTVLSVGLTTLGVWMAARHWHLPRSAAVLTVATSPFLFVYQRALWDNVFLIPISALLAWATGAFLARPSGPRAAAITATMILLAYVHPVALPALIATAAIVLLFEHRWLWVHRRTSLACAAVLFAAAASLAVAISRASHGDATPLPRSWVSGLTAPFLAGRVFSHARLLTFLGANWHAGLPTPMRLPVFLLQGISVLAIPVTLLGGVLAVLAVWRRRRQHFRLHHKLLLLALLTVLAFGLLCLFLQLPAQLHYLNAAWPAYLALLLYGFRCLSRRRRGRRLFAAFLLANAGLLFTFIFYVHAYRGNRTPLYGPVLSVQIATVKQLNTYAKDSQLDVRIPNYQMFPHALQTLMDLYISPTAPAEAPRRALVLDYAMEKGISAQLVLRDNGPVP